MLTKQNGTDGCMIRYIELERMVRLILIDSLYIFHFHFKGLCLEVPNSEKKNIVLKLL
jgi:hypothetical protein